MNATAAANAITRAYGTWKVQNPEGGWMSTWEIFKRTDLTHDTARAGIRHLRATDTGFADAADPRRNWHTEAEAAAQIEIGPDVIGLISWR